MKRLIFSFITVILTLQAHGQNMILPGKGQINVENLNTKIDYNMDLSQLSLSELRVLRNAIAARQGYLFKWSDLRDVFISTTWYFDKAFSRVEGKQPEIRYTAEETAFINRVKAREAELLKQNFSPAGGGRVNTDNIVNPYNLDNFPNELKAALTRNGFAIVPAEDEQLFQIYEKNMYGEMPSFVTTDLFMQLYHMFFDSTLRKVEESTLLGAMTEYCEHMYQQMDSYAHTATNKDLRAAAEWNKAYFAVALSLFTGNKAKSVAPEYADDVKNEIERVNAENNNYSEFLGYTTVKFNYSLFRPRGHYTRSEAVKRYFRGMMWLQTVPFGTDIAPQVIRAAVIAEVMHNNARAMQLYRRIDEPIRYLMGEYDNISITQLYDIMSEQNVTPLTLATKKNVMKTFVKAVDALGEKNIRIRPVFERTSHIKINVMPQRYTPDAEVLLKTVDYYGEPTQRDVPMGLDFMAAMGITPAKDILYNELNELQRWAPLADQLNEMSARMGEIDWTATIYNRWERSLRELCLAKDTRYPYFMKTPQWDKKNLNAALAAWAELKHDAILYAKQPIAAECGDADELPEPITRAYVEPNIRFWKEAIETITQLAGVLEKYQLLTPDTRGMAETICEQAQFLLNVSEKELNGTAISDEDYDRLRYIGATYEDITLNLVLDDTEYGANWSLVTGADKNVAIVADVYTSNGDNNPNPSILYEAVGPADEIYVVVEIDGLLYLMRGAVFSYREFKWSIDKPRLTDEEWQEMLPQNPMLGVPSWMNELRVPLKEAVKLNEEIFYSGGC